MLLSPQKMCLGGGAGFINTAFFGFTHSCFISNIPGEIIPKRYSKGKERFLINLKSKHLYNEI